MTAATDPTLVTITRGPGDRHMLAVTALAAAILLGLWGATGWYYAATKAPATLSASESNRAAVTRALLTPVPQIVYAGSSLILTLPAPYARGPEVINLGLAGGSVMTGLELLAAWPSVPRVVVVETNILDRPADPDLVRDFAGAPGYLRLLLRGDIRPLRLLLSQPRLLPGDPARERRQAVERRDRLLAAPPAPRTHPIADLARGFDERRAFALAEANAARLGSLVAALEARGARVLLVDLPYAEPLTAHPYPRRNRRLASGNEAFDCPRCLDVARLLPEGVLGFTDGLHLDERSAILVIDAIEREIDRRGLLR